MPRPKYRITEDDYQHAHFYLSRSLRDYQIEFNDATSHAKAEKAFYEATDSIKKNRKKKAEQLNVWAEKHLSSKDWQKLKSGIRKRRERWSKEQKTVTISEKAHKLLIRVSKRDEVTYSGALEYYLEKALRSRRGMPKFSRRPKR